MLSPSHPQWEPDPTGERLATIRAARRGAILATAIFGLLVAVAVWLTPPEGLGAPAGAGILALVMSLPGLALLGAVLTPATLASRRSAASAGFAIGLGVPVFGTLSAVLAVWIVVGLLVDHDTAGAVAGRVLRDGVTAAVRLAPLIALACLAWVAGVRRIARPRGGAGEASLETGTSRR